jgi:RHS repeat-associated protein
LRIVPASPLLDNVELRVLAGKLHDDWNNTNGLEVFTFPATTPPGTVIHSGPAVGSTRTVVRSRSQVGNAFLFHGQYFDYESGLLYCRARFYEPSSGLFLQPDPEGFAGGANQYAAFANNPVTLRDPTGSLPDWNAMGQTLSLIGAQASYEKDGLAGALVGGAISFAGAVLQLGTGAAEGLELLETQKPGTLGLLDIMQGTRLIAQDVAVAGAALGVGTTVANGAYRGVRSLAANGGLGASERIKGFFNGPSTRPRAGAEMRAFLRERGFTGIEIDSIAQAMQEQGVSSVSIRSFGAKAGVRRQNVLNGHQQKPMHVKEKTNGKALVEHDGIQYTSDADLFAIEINGRPARPAETERFFNRANKLYSEKWQNTVIGDKAVAGGRAATPNPPFQHGAHIDMARQHGTMVGDAFINDNYLYKVGHPGDTVTIRVGGDGNILAHDTPRWLMQRKLDQYESVLSNRQFMSGSNPVGWGPTKDKSKDWYQWSVHRYHPKALLGFDH